jgi:hypothetical protein
LKKISTIQKIILFVVHASKTVQIPVKCIKNEKKQS